MNAVAQIRPYTRQPKPEPAPFSLAMEAGQEEMWAAFRDLPKSGFTPAVLARVTGASVGQAESYLLKLTRNGIAVRLGLNDERNWVYAVPRMGVDPAVYNMRGQPDADYAIRKTLWVGLRHRRETSVAGLWAFAREHVDVTKAKVEKFLKRLVAANFVIEMEEWHNEPATIYALRPKMNTGPLPPRFCEAELVYDVNTRQFFGRGEAHQVAL